jgi:hypothetical protein
VILERIKERGERERGSESEESVLERRDERDERRDIIGSLSSSLLPTSFLFSSLYSTVSVFLPSTALPFVISRLEADGASVAVEGSVWDEAHQHALHFVEQHPGTSSPSHLSPLLPLPLPLPLPLFLFLSFSGSFLVHPFDHPEIWEGHVSLIEEMAEQIKLHGAEKPAALILSGDLSASPPFHFSLFTIHFSPFTITSHFPLLASPLLTSFLPLA